MIEAYLGDGVYASFDGYTIWLRTERYDDKIGCVIQHRIALEPDILLALNSYAEAVYDSPTKTDS